MGTGCGSVVGAILLCVVFFVGACSESTDPSTDADQGSDPSASASEAKMDGAAAWEAGNCTMCHGADGAGSKFGPDLTKGVWNNCDGTAEGIRGVLASGVTKEQMGDRPWAMPMPAAPEAVASDEALDVLTKHVLSLSN